MSEGDYFMLGFVVGILGTIGLIIVAIILEIGDKDD